MSEARRATAIHEAGHAVVSYLVGRRIIHTVLFSDELGETMTEWSICQLSFEYYEKNDPNKDPESKRIQDALRCDMAIAVAGEIAQRDLCGDSNINQSEFDRDIERANCGAAHIHRGLDPHCCFAWDQTRCEFCKIYLASMRSAVKQILTKALVSGSVKALAADKLESLIDLKKEKGSKIEEFLELKGLIAGSEIDSLPQIPEAWQCSKVRFPRPFY